MLSEEERRLGRAIRAIVLASGASVFAVGACGGTDHRGSPDASGAPADDASAGGAARDATDDSATDAARPEDAEIDAPDDGRIPLCPAGPAAPHPAIDGGAYLDASDEGGCDHFFEYQGCSPAPIYPGVGCYFSRQDCARICGFSTSAGCFVTPDNCSSSNDQNVVLDAAALVVNCTNCIGGRRPEGMPVFVACGAATEVGAWFARAAHLEAVSITAFRRLRVELGAHGAPPELREEAGRAAVDEVRHTRATARLARRFGGRPAFLRARRRGVRALEAVAVENAAEGCVRETYGAIVAAWQSVHAADDGVRAEMVAIAADEARHAALAWAIARWADGSLDAPARARVAAARGRAIEELRAELAAEPPASLVVTAGVPTGRAAAKLFDGALRTLWG